MAPYSLRTRDIVRVCINAGRSDKISISVAPHLKDTNGLLGANSGIRVCYETFLACRTEVGHITEVINSWQPRVIQRMAIRTAC
jgi:hypothetical protein